MNSMYVALGYLCNHDCFFCPCGEKSKLPSIAGVEELIDAIAEGIDKHNIDQIVLSGGEPTLNPGFKQILKYCTEQGLFVTVLTNGDSLADLQKTEKLFGDIERKYVKIISAIHSIKPEIHEKVTNSKGSFQRTMNGLLNLINMGFSVTVKQVISKWNYRDLPDFIEYIFENFGPSVGLTLCGMDFCGMTKTQIDEIAVNYPVLGPFLERALDIVISLKVDHKAFSMVNVTDLPLCCVDPYYWSFFSKVSRGTIAQYSAPEGKESVVSKHVEIQNDCDTYFEECKKCCVADLCPGVWSSAWSYFGKDSVKTVVPYME